MKSKKAKSATTPTPEGATPVAAAPVATGAGTGKYRGKGTCTSLGIPAGLRRMAFQDALMAANLRLKYDDAKLAALMDGEHPGGVPMRPDHIRAIRRLYNAGVHTKAGRVPAVPTPKFVNGEPVAESRTKKESSKAA